MLTVYRKGFNAALAGKKTTTSSMANSLQSVRPVALTTPRSATGNQAMKSVRTTGIKRRAMVTSLDILDLSDRIRSLGTEEKSVHDRERDRERE